MQTPRFIRISRWYLSGILNKYKIAAILGVIIGLCIGIFGKGIASTYFEKLSVQTYRIGYVGIDTIDKLPDEILQKISSGLTTISDQGTAESGLAYTWEATDSGKSYIFNLRKDLVWHSGKPVVAGDVNYQIQNVTFSVVNPNTLKADLSAPFTPFPILVSRPLFQKGLIGFGPYMVDLVKRKGDAVIYLKLVSKTKEGPIYEYRFFQTETEAILAFKQGDIDQIEQLTQIDNLGNWNNVKITPISDKKRILTVFFNMKKPELQNRQLRQLLGYLLPDVPQTDRAYSPIGSNSWAYTDKVKKYTYDPTHAKKMYTDAKIPPTITLTISTFPQYVSYAEKLKDSWSLLGIPVSISVIQSIPTDYQILLSSQIISPDPDQYLLWHSTQTDTNITGYANVKIDKLLEDGRKELDMTTRKQIYMDFQKYLVEDAPALFWLYPVEYTVERK
jgi:peptide/nickel transport system substrate-binding protein